MKRAFFNLQIGPPRPIWDLCLKTQQEYCKRYNIDHYISRKPFIDYKWCPSHGKIYFEKLQCLSLFDKGYDQVLMIDCDVLITPAAKNIFDIYTDLDKIYAYDENQTVGIMGDTLYGEKEDIMDRDPYIRRIIKNLKEPFEWRKNHRDKYRFYNTGVFMFGRNTASIFKNSNKFNSLVNTKNIYDFWEQTYISSIIQKYDIPNESIDYSFNRMNLGKRDQLNERYKANFIHYAGPCLYNIEEHLEFTEQRRADAIFKDYNNLYE
jgi:hypothetical protein